jgi:hypothetical protein
VHDLTIVKRDARSSGRIPTDWTAFRFEVEMRKPISRKQHGVANYASLGNTLFTRAEWGVVKVLPYKAHLAIDAITGVAALAAPWMLGFSNDRRARNTFLSMGVTALVVTLLSRPEEMRAGR